MEDAKNISQKEKQPDNQNGTSRADGNFVRYDIPGPSPKVPDDIRHYRSNKPRIHLHGGNIKRYPGWASDRLKMLLEEEKTEKEE